MLHRFNPLSPIIIHQTHYEKSDWSRAFNQFTIACELQILHLSCQVQRLPGYQAPWSVLLRNRMTEQRRSINVYKDFPLRIFLF